MKVITEAPRMGRKIRSPQHTWTFSTVPFAITPFLAAPVLPGETLKNAVFQTRVVTSPIANSLIGWWKEYYFFYVKLSQLESWDKYQKMLVDPKAEQPSGTSADVETFSAGGAIHPYVREAYDAVYYYYFSMGPQFVTGGGDNMRLLAIKNGSLYGAKAHGNSWLDSHASSGLRSHNDAELVVGTDDKITGTELEQLMLQYELAKSGGVTDLTYEEWLAKQGVNVPGGADDGKPELLRFVREWTYPSNTVNPADGTVSGVCSWAVSGRIDKDRFFKEPGLILGVTIARPKIYMGNQKGNVMEYMTRMEDWLGGIIGDVNDATERKFTAAAGPLNGQTTDYWVDFRDLLMYGDQFRGDQPAGTMSLPAERSQYPTDAMVASLFKVGTEKWVKEDGVVSLRIASRVRDPYPDRGGFGG